jgi:hypothetical protein
MMSEVAMTSDFCRSLTWCPDREELEVLKHHMINNCAITSWEYQA